MAGRVRFGSFEFDTRTRELRKHGVRVRVPDQSLKILNALIEHPGEVVSREDLRQQLWPRGTIVEFEHSVNAAIQRLREALSDSAAGPKYIETLAKRGYRFIAVTETIAPPPEIAHYRIVEEIGRGSMGIVYRAEDLRLGRRVALKMLPSDLAFDPQRKSRLLREARAASALNHPNIVTVHDIDSDNGRDFIVMEYVSGKSLEHIIAGKPMPLEKVLAYAFQIAGALASAHAAGVIHRDLKPGNVMVTSDRIVKLLDFGVAKFMAAPPVSESLPTRIEDFKTSVGAVVGTAPYLSPEQARGLPVDARSDIFSFGTVLYEMTTGRCAFASLRSVVNDEPVVPTQLVPVIPSELEQIILRCLQKEPDRRFQTMTELESVLRRIENELFETVPHAAQKPPRRAWVRKPVQIGGALLVVGALGFGISVAVFRHTARPAAWVSKLTALSGIQGMPALSPDGKQVAFVWDGEKERNYDIYTQLVGDLKPRRLTKNPALDYGPVWSPDALHIGFLREIPAGTEVIIVPSAGGTEEVLHVSNVRCGGAVPQGVAKASCGLAWSPDGRFLAFVDKESDNAPASVFALDMSTHDVHRLTTPPPGSADGLSVFSPDGRRLAFVRRPGYPLRQIYVVDLSQDAQAIGTPRQITHDSAFVYGLDWSADGRHIIYSSSGGGVYALWRVPASGGEPERLSVGGADAFFPSVATKADRLVYLYAHSDYNVWMVAPPNAATNANRSIAPVRVTPSPEWDQEPAFSPNGKRVAWSSVHSGNHQIWVSDLDGSRITPLTHFDVGAAGPQWSPDGRQIAFYGAGPRAMNVFVIASDGGQARRLTTGDFEEGAPSWSHDGKWVYFDSDRGAGPAIWKVAVTGGRPILLARDGGGPVESRDGRSVYYSRANGGIGKVPSSGGAPVLLTNAGSELIESFDGKFVYSSHGGDIWRTPAQGGNAVLVLRKGARADWAVSAYGIYLLDPDAKSGPALEFIPFAAAASKTFTLPGEPDDYTGGIGRLSVSSDGRWCLYMHRDAHETAIMLVDNFR